MSEWQPHEVLGLPNQEHIGLLDDTLRAPSAHNAQPWIIRPLPDGQSYELHYNQSEELPEDHDNKDAYLTMGAFVETMVLEGPNRGFDVNVTPQLTCEGRDLYIAHVAITSSTEEHILDPLSSVVRNRTTNRSAYKKDPLPDELKQDLEALGNAIADPKALQDVVLEANMNAWASERYVADLKRWFHKSDRAPDGLTASALRLGRLGTLALDLAFWRGKFKSRPMQWLYASSEASMFTKAPSVAVLSSTDMSPPALFDAGRRLLRSWVTINAAGYSYQPYSVAVDDRSTLPKVAAISGVEHPVALYRIGQATRAQHRPSNRKPLQDVLSAN